MGRQWLQKNREINANRRGKILNKLVREITIAARAGLPDPAMNPKLAVAVEAARKQSVSNDTIARAIKKGSGQATGEAELELIAYEGFTPHNVPVVIECLTDNRNRTAPDIRSMFKKGQFGTRVMFLFDHLGIIEATHDTAGLDLEEAAIEAGAQNVEALETVPEGQSGGRFYTDPGDLDAVTKQLRAAGWSVTTSELGYLAKDTVPLTPEQRTEVEEFLAAIDDHDDVHRIYTAL